MLMTSALFGVLASTHTMDKKRSPLELALGMYLACVLSSV